jgi:hypothetical protein
VYQHVVSLAHASHTPWTGPSRLFFAGLSLASPIGISASINRIFEPILKRHMARPSPLQTALRWSLAYPHPSLDALLDEITQHTGQGPEFIKLAKDQADHLLDLLIGIESHLVRGVANLPNRERKTEFPPASLLELALMPALLQDMSLGLTHRAF